MIHGPGNKGNLNLLFKIVSKGLPWPLGAFENKRSFCSIDNLCFIINELIENENIPTGIYNIADDIPLSTNKLIRLISESQGKKPLIWDIPKFIIKIISLFGDLLHLPLNTERLSKLTETYIVSNVKIKKAINKPLPVNTEDSLLKTFISFNH
jgi:nucleoside-diphosphate-sugar epimerase